LSDQQIGFVLTLTFVGDAIISLLITRVADRLGRRRMLLVGAGLVLLAGSVFAFATNPFLLALAACVGTLSPNGSEIGPFLAIEQAALAQISANSRRTRLFAWYTLVGALATACGSFSGGALATSLQRAGSAPLDSYRVLFVGYAVLGIVLGLLVARLSGRVEVTQPAGTRSSGFAGLHRSRTIVRNLSLLFMLDSFAGS